MLLHRSLCAFLSLAILILFVGCGDRGLDVVPVKGTVTYQNKPIGKINVMFVPSDAKGHIAEGTTDENGQFQLQTMKPGDGAIAGNYKVSFKFVSDIIPDMPGFTNGVKPEPSPIPLKYADENKSGFTATVDSNATKNDFKFDLK
ncbi:MAG: hypothetical protein U0905_00810 [Pirellulales bacterium]